MSPYDFKKPMTFYQALEQFALAHQCVMVALRDEAEFHDDGDPAILNVAGLFCSMIEDTHHEAEALLTKLEKRVTGMA